MKRRVSYTIPAPVDHVPQLRLPDPGTSRFGLTGPLLIPLENTPSSRRPSTSSQHYSRGRHLPIPRHPRHRLGVPALALDASTQLAGNGSPEGILYSGGRDGMVNSWDLHVPMRSREKDKFPKHSRGPYEGHRWEVMTGWADEFDDDEEFGVDGDVLGDVTASMRKRRGGSQDLPYERRWEIRPDSNGIPTTTFRQSAELHTEWVNDIALCNHNQTVVSASSDGTIKSWNPHGGEISVLGRHDDYVRCLSVCREHDWIVSGSFDRTIKLWDLSQSASNPLITMQPVDAAQDPKCSVYALAADPQGHVIASGSPERIVRLWDPRSGKGTGKLVGHTDNIRAILISDDGRYLLTASTDASIKLWSLSSPQRCLHTFTYHTDSVWSLYSSHPSLETFYSGDKSGLVCRVDVTGVGAFEGGDVSMSSSITGFQSSSGIALDRDVLGEPVMDIGSGECLLVAAVRSGATERGVDRIVVLDDQLLWTASGTMSEISRWRVPPKTNDRRGRTHAHLHATGARERSASTATSTVEDDDSSVKAYDSPASLHASLPPTTPSKHHKHRLPQSHSHSHSPHPSPRPALHHQVSALSHHHYNSTPSHKVTYASSLIRLPSTVPDIAAFRHKGRDPDSQSLASHFRANSPNPSLNFSSTLSSHTHLHHEHAQEAELPELAADAVPYNADPDGVIPGDRGLVRCVILNDRVHALAVDTAGEVGVWDIVRGVCLGVYRDPCQCGHTSPQPTHQSPPRSPGSIRSPLPNQPQHQPACHCHHFSPREALENVRTQIEGEGATIPTWATCDTKSGVLSVHLDVDRCFDAEIYADEVGFPKVESGDDLKLNVGKWVLKNLFLGFIREEQRERKRRDSSASASTSPPPTRPAKSLSSIHPATSSPTLVPALPPSSTSVTRKLSSPLLTPMIPLMNLNTGDALPSIPQSPDVSTPLVSGSMTRRPTLHRIRSASMHDVGEATPQVGKDKEGDYFSPRATETVDENKPQPQTPATPSGGLMTRLKSFGKTKKTASEVPPPTLSVPTIAEQEKETENNEINTNAEEVAKAQVFSSELSPPPSSEAPVHALPSNVTVTISEDHTAIYRGTVNTMGQDVKVLEEAMPLWLLEYLLLNKLPPAPALVKISFVLLPWQGEGLADEEKLPELLNITQSKLTASRWLRVRKLVLHVQEKLEKLAPTNSLSSPRTSLESHRTPTPAGRPSPEDLYEILCNDVVLPLDMTLAGVRQYVWRQGGELTMHYRTKRVPKNL